MLEFRDARPEDIPDIIALNRFFANRFLSDDEILVDEAFEYSALVDARTIVFMDDSRTVVGCMSFSDINQDLSAVIHLIMRPAYLRTFLKEYVWMDALLDRFRVMGVQSFIIAVPTHNRVAVNLAKQTGFRFIGTLSKQAYKNRRVYDRVFYQLERKDLAAALRQRFLEENAVDEKSSPSKSNVAPLKIDKGAKRNELLQQQQEQK